MAFDPSTAREFDPTSAVETGGFDPSTAKEFDPSTAILTKEESAKAPVKAEITIEQPQDNRKVFQPAVDAAPDETTFKKLTPNVSTVLAAIDTITGTIGLPASWIVAARVYAQSGNADQAYAALETTKEWSSVRTALQHYGKRFGLNEKALEETLYEPNFIDNLFQKIDEKALEPLARKAGYNEKEDGGIRGIGKHLLKDSVMLGAFPAAGKLLPKRARTGGDPDVAAILKEKEIAKQNEPITKEAVDAEFTTKQTAFDFDPTTAKPVETSPLKGQGELFPELTPEVKEMRTFGFGPEDKIGRFLPRFFSSSSESVKEKIDQIVSPYESISQLAKEETANAASGFKSESDISALIGQWNANTVTVNQLPMIIKSPTITLVVNKIKEAEIIKNQHAYDIAAQLHQFEKLAEKPELEYKSLAVIEELQKKPYQEFGKAAGLPEATDTQLISLGLPPDKIGAFRKIREINEMINKIRTEARQRLGVDDVESPIWSYHPKSYGVGDQMLTVADKKTGKIVFHHKFMDFAEMKAKKKEVIKSLTDANEIHNYDVDSRSNAKDWHNPFTNLDQSKLPEVVQRIMASIEEKIETRERTFEMERVPHDIQGLVQYLENGKPDPMLKEVWLSYIEMVLNFDKHSRLFELQKDLLDNNWYYKDKGSLYDFTKNLVQGELGQDTTWKPIKGMERGLTWSHSKIARGIETLKGTEVTRDDFVINNGSIRRGAKFSAAMASSATLLFNAPNALLNATQIPLTGIIGLPLDIIGRLRANPAQTVKWTIEANVEFGRALSELVYTLESGKETRASKILNKYNRDGQVKALMFDEIAQAAEGYSHGIGRQIAKGMNFGKKWTNDLFIEMPTNATSLLYYDILINEIAKDHLIKSGVTKAQRDMLPVLMAKSWVGDYARYAKPEYLKKSGFIGDAVSNFANWPHNQWGRFVEAIQELKPEKGKAIYPQLGMLLGMWYVYANLAGGKNAPVAATLDTLRQWHNESKDTEEESIPDMDYFAKEYGIPNWLHPQETLFDKAQGAMGIENPIDLSTGQRFANPIQINTLTPEFYWSLGKTAILGMKMLAGAEAWGEDTTKPVGVTRKQILSATNKMPHILKGFLNEEYAQFERPDGKKAIVNKFDNLAFTQENETEEFMNKLGIKTVRQREERKKIAHNRYYQQKLENQPKKIKAHIMSQVTEYLEDPESSFADLVTIEENITRLQNLDPDWNKSLARELEEKYGKMTELPEEQIERAAKKDIKAAKLIRLKKMWDRLGLYD